MNDSINVIKKDSQVRVELNDILGRYNRLFDNYQESKIGYTSLTQNFILEELIIIMGTTKTDLDIELKFKTSRTEYL